MREPIERFTEEYRFLSNFYPSRITVVVPCWKDTNTQCYADTVEHAYQAAKTLDPEDYLHVISAPDPGSAKRRGRGIDIRPDWEDVKLGYMNEYVRAKFRIPELAEKLLATGDRELIEGNSWKDTYWGVCNGVGENHLGRILMTIRDEHREQQT